MKSMLECIKGKIAQLKTQPGDHSDVMFGMMALYSAAVLNLAMLRHPLSTLRFSVPHLIKLVKGSFKLMTAAARDLEDENFYKAYYYNTHPRSSAPEWYCKVLDQLGRDCYELVLLATENQELAELCEELTNGLGTYEVSNGCCHTSVVKGVSISLVKAL